MYAIVFLILTVYDLEVRANLRRKVFGFDAWRGGVGWGDYNPFLVYCRELASGTVSLIGDQAQGDDSKHESHYTSVI